MYYKSLPNSLVCAYLQRMKRHPYQGSYPCYQGWELHFQASLEFFFFSEESISGSYGQDVAFAGDFYNSELGPWGGWDQGDLQGSKKGDGIPAAAERSGSEWNYITDTCLSVEMQQKHSFKNQVLQC